MCSRHSLPPTSLSRSLSAIHLAAVVALGLPVLRDICASLHVVAPATRIRSRLKNKKTSMKEVFLFFGGGGGSRTRVRKSSAIGSTCLADSLSLTACYPNGREDKQRFRKVLTNPPRTGFIAILCESTPGSACTSTTSVRRH